MKNFQKSLIVLLLVLPFSLSSAVTNSEDIKDPKVGDILVVNLPSSEHFEHIYFPDPSEIQRKVGSVNYKQVLGIEAKITKVERSGNGSFMITLKPLYGKKFFGHWKTVRANYTQAMASGELNISQ